MPAIQLSETEDDLNTAVDQFTGNNLTSNLDNVQAGLLNTLVESNDGSNITNGGATPATPTINSLPQLQAITSISYNK